MNLILRRFKASESAGIVNYFKDFATQKVYSPMEDAEIKSKLSLMLNTVFHHSALF